MTKNSDRTLVVGAGSMGREIAAWLNSCESHCPPFAGFIDDNREALVNHSSRSPGIVGAVSDYMPRENDRFIMGIADPRTKLTVGRQLTDRGAQFVQFIHPTVLISADVELGRGVVALPRAVISCDARIGDFVALNIGASVGHDVHVGDGCTLSAHVDITGFCDVGEGVFFGSHAVTLPRAKIGAYSKVGAGTVVLRSVASGASVMGVPAKQIFPGI